MLRKSHPFLDEIVALQLEENAVVACSQLFLHLTEGWPSPRSQSTTEDDPSKFNSSACCFE